MFARRADPKVALVGVAIASLTAMPQVALAQEAFRVEITADTNRDGVVDAADREGRDAWTAARGAIILPNIADSAGRCPRASDKAFSDAQLEACHDAQDNVARAAHNFAPVRLAPVAGLSKKAKAAISVAGKGADKVRIFIRRGDRWDYVSATDAIGARELGAGVELGVDARDVVRNRAVWDGTATITVTIRDGARTASDSVMVKVAPVLLHNHTERAETVYAPLSGDSAAHAKFMTDLGGALGQAGFKTPIQTIQTEDIWAQDFVEFGYVAMPRPNGQFAKLRIALRSPQPTRKGGRALFDLRSADMGVVQLGGDAYHQADSFGNVETSPPYERDGRSYPTGRVIYGDAGDGDAPHTDMVRFFEAQAQDPILLDTSWLIIGHVDEFLQFLPADNARGWVIAVKDVPAAYAILRKAQADGHGDTPAFSHPDAPKLTINEVLADKKLAEDNELSRRKVELNLQILMEATGLTEADILRVPGLFHEAEFGAFARRARERDNANWSPPPPEFAPPEQITYGLGTMIAYYPAAVNGLLLDRTNYIVPKQWGPVVAGRDIMQDGVDAAYARLGIRAWTVDDWLSHHSFGGEIHCGTNTTRTFDGEWWK